MKTGSYEAVGSATEKTLWKEYIKAAVVAIVLALFVRTFVAQAFKIPSESMLHSLQVGDHLLVNKMVYRFKAPERGEIIVFKYPRDLNRDFVKRIVGLPGETIEMKGATVKINGKELDEPYAIYKGELTFNHFGPYKIPKGHLFMMGDNRNNSQDSRVWGPLDMSIIHGKAFIIHWAWEDHSWGVRWNRIGKLLG